MHCSSRLLQLTGMPQCDKQLHLLDKSVCYLSEYQMGKIGNGGEGAVESRVYVTCGLPLNAAQ